MSANNIFHALAIVPAVYYLLCLSWSKRTYRQIHTMDLLPWPQLLRYEVMLLVLVALTIVWEVIGLFTAQRILFAAVLLLPLLTRPLRGFWWTKARAVAGLGIIAAITILHFRNTP